MIDPKMIPHEVVEAAADAIFKRRLHGMKADFATLFDATKEAYRNEARAAIAAGLAAWPGSVTNYNWDGSRWRIVLPMSQEMSDD